MSSETMLESLDRALAEKDWDYVLDTVASLPRGERSIPIAIRQSRAYEGCGNLPGAQEVLDEAVHRWPRNPWLLHRLAEVLVLGGQWILARDVLGGIVTDVNALRDGVERLRLQVSLVIGDVENAMECVDWLVGGEPDKTSLRAFHRESCFLRQRTNSLLSGPFSNKYNGSDVARKLGSTIKRAQERGLPFSLVSLGDGEGSFLRGRNKTAVGATSSSSGSFELSMEALRELQDLLVNACENADILGLPREDMNSENYGAAITLLSEKTRNRVVVGDLMLTDCHCHYDLYGSGALDDIISAQGYVGYVGGRDIRAFFGKQFPKTKLSWYEVPVQNGQGVLKNESHYPFYFERLREDLPVPFPGALFLVAAGILGKIYCGWIRERGGVAIDIGAVADMWGGRTDTRAFIVNNDWALGADHA